MPIFSPMDYLPLWGLFAATVFLVGLSIEAGYRLTAVNSWLKLHADYNFSRLIPALNAQKRCCPRAIKRFTSSKALPPWSLP